ncbi:YciI family protein [Microbacterium sp. AZCO]|uniref:YciI family protein n=1 Tax=Microbacterium sp. AZCO TaxID=3142976 RepID=UPI0031F34231
MRWMLIMQVEPEAAARAAEELDLAEVVQVMGAYNEELQKAGVFLSAEGLSDASEGFRVDFSSQPPVVTDGPYAEAREIFTGFWILEVASREEAEHWARKCPLGPGTSLEVRRVQELSDFITEGEDDAVSEWASKAQEWRAANA